MATWPASTRPVVTLGLSQTLAWASSYYLPAMLAVPMARDIGVSTPTVFAAFSCSIGLSAFVGPWSGKMIDRYGGRPVLMGTSIMFAAGLTALGLAWDTTTLFLAWLVLGLAMGAGLYEAAFSTIVRLLGAASRNPITGITLIAGFASTVGWPLSSLLEAHLGWRGACFSWAAMHLLIGLPLNFSIPRIAAPAAPGAASTAPAATPAPPIEPVTRPGLTTAILAYVFAITWFISTAMAAHLPLLLQAGGASAAAAVGIGALIGPAQVAARLFEASVLRRVHPLLSARLAAICHPIGAIGLATLGAPVAAGFAIIHGAGNGILTIAKGTLPLILFGANGYGARQGWLTMPARIAQALAPFAFGLALAHWGAGALWLSAGLGMSSFIALWFLPTRKPAAQQRTAG